MDNQQLTQPSASSASAKAPRKKMYMILAALCLILAMLTAVALVDNKKTTDDSKKALEASKQVNTLEVSVTDEGFSPATVKIKTGQAVTWTNTGTAAHQIASDPHPADNGVEGLSDDEAMQKGDAYSYTFEKAGTYTYHDEMNPLKFYGTVIVE